MASRQNSPSLLSLAIRALLTGAVFSLSPPSMAADEFVPLGHLAGGGFESYALGVNADGSVVVGQGTRALGAEVFRWTQAGGMAPLGDLAGGGFYSVVLGVNADGSVVVGYSGSGNGTEAFRWTQASGMQTVTAWLAANGVAVAPGYTLTEAYGVNSDGTVVVGHGSGPSGTEAWLARGPRRFLRPDLGR
ncbi:MAG: hypothetical protein KJ558_09245 [Gammaproteobacteria bacterium]|nr:hypothetical protein [Gammaproteobacteria bacterium]MBU1654993.1 hypothetical protein [Gammaproteobacteria bacterium]MBU1960014.1 hypothetical protein [Gammaproteobacteria bacterium]